MDGAPTLTELTILAGLLLGGVLLLLLAWQLLKRFARGHWDGLLEPSPWQPLWAVVSASGGLALLWLMWLNLESIAARMGVTVLALLLLLAAESRRGGRRQP